jgi:vitamin B12 transporter
VEQVESIESMKGAASSLYGSGAAAGVINISKKAGKQLLEMRIWYGVPNYCRQS